MPLIPDPSRNFINALSGFWTAFFRDADELTAYYEGVQLNLGQIYLEMLQTILGTSLKDMPLFSRYYYKYLELRRDRLFYVEGASPSEDTYEFTPPDLTLADVSSILNRVVAPTATLVRTRDYYVRDGAIRFRRDLFNVDGNGTTEPLFPVRTLSVVEPAQFTDPVGRNWAAAGVKIGDWFCLRVLGGGSPILVRIVGVDGSKLLLGDTAPEFEQNFARRNVRISVVRTPFDREKIGVLLPANPRLTVRASNNLTDAAINPGTMEVVFTTEPYFKGFWTPATSYTAGDLVHNGVWLLYRAKVDHVSGPVFDPTMWDQITNCYIYVDDPESFENSGLFYCFGGTNFGTVTLWRPRNFIATLSNRARITFVFYSGTFTANMQPELLLPQTFIDVGSLSIVARRATPVVIMNSDGSTTTYPVGENVIEGVDYVVDYEAGKIIVRSAWSDALPARVNYTWMRAVAVYDYVDRGEWTAFTAYNVGDIVTHGGTVYICFAPDPGSPVFSIAFFRPYIPPFEFNVTASVPVMALWGANTLVDEEALYNNFGYLLGYKKPTSEQYRTFLRGVAQLFLLGPTLERFESAMNVMAGFPVVRDDDEVLRGYDNGIVASGVDGQLIDSAEGRDGVLNAALEQFYSPTAGFFPSDIGAVIRVQNGTSVDEYTVTAVLSPTTVVVAPTPPDAVNVTWSYTHVALTTRFRVTAGSYLFGQEDVNGSIIVQGSGFARNNGVFRILAVENNTTVILETPYGFTDQSGLTWALSRTNQQRVITSRATYSFPLLVAMRPDVVDPASVNVLKFRAFEALTDAFRVVDYLRDPTWWHNVVIPSDVLKLDVDVSSRRKVSPTLIEHIYGALDTPVYGDFGLAYDVDDEGQPGEDRAGKAWWYGANSIVLSFDPGVPTARTRDIGQHIIVSTPGFKGYFPIEAVQPDGVTLTLGRFPPPEAEGTIPPVQIDVKLPPLLYRRTVAFVMMDRFLKYHAVLIRIDKNTPLPSEFIPDVVRLINEAKPSHTYIYLDSLTDFVDKVHLNENFTLGYGPFVPETIRIVHNNLIFGPPGIVRHGDAFQYTETTTGVPGAPGTYTLPATLPPGDVQTTLVKARFDPTVLIGGVRRPAEGVDYIVNYNTMEITILGGFPAGPNILHYVYCIRRHRNDGDPLDPGETRLAHGGTDPTIYRAATQSANELGLVDRAVQITLGA
jgi:hypothetical protein